MLANPRAAWFTFPAMADFTIPNRPALAEALKKAGAELSLDVFVPQDAPGRLEDPAEAHAPLLGLADMVFPNEHEAAAVTGRDNLGDMLACLRDMGVEIAVIKRGDRGAAVS